MTTTRIYLQFGDIKGTATDLKHKDWVELNSCSFGFNRSITQNTGSGARSVGAPSVGNLSLTKDMNLATQQIFAEAIAGKGVDSCLIHFVGDNNMTFMEYKLLKPIMCDYHVSVSRNGGEPSESFSISFTAIETTYSPTTGSNRKAGYDVQQAKII